MADILEAIRDELPEEWASNAGDYEQIFDLLQQREQHFEAISEQLRRLVA